MSSSISKAPPPALNVLGPIPSLQMDDEEMRDQQESPGPMKSPKGGKNTLGLTLPGGNAACTHSVDSMLCPGSPPRRIILEADRSSQQLLGGGDQQQQRNISSLLKTPPLICEQGPSAPSSPTTPSPGARSAKRPCPLSVDALQRLNLLSPNYMPSAHMDSSTKGGGLPPVSPGYPTSDLGSSPRSSISASHYSSLGINAANWNSFRDAYTRRHGAGSGDDDASECGMDKAGTHAMLLSPCHQMLSPAPFSPFSDCGVADLHVASASATPYSSRSPNLSPSPMRRSAGNNLHFSFDQIRSRSSLSNHGSGTQEAAQRQAIMHQKSLDSDARERSRSEGEALAADNQGNRDDHLDEHMDTSHGQGHSTLSVPAGAGGSHLHAGQKRRLQRSRRAGGVEEDGGGSAKTTTSSRQQQTGTTKAAEGISQQDSLTGPGPSASQQPSRQPTIEEPPPSPTLTELFQPGDLDKDRRRQVEDWIRQQTAALEAFRHSLIPPQQEANLLQVPTIVPQNSLEQLWPSPSADQSQAGPIRSPTLWRRSRSESDVSAATAAAVAEGNRTAGSAAGSRRQSQQAPQLMIPLNEATHVCEHCGQGFSMHDRLAKHIASRHRDRSSSMNDEGNRVHKCQLCPKSFGRSDMLTRHMRLHTGLKPYACQLCGQVFSRSDHLSTHQRTHTGEKPYRCPQCNYAASRRDMITRHMRTHLMADGSPTPFAEFQIPPINELSLNPSCASQSAVVSPQPSRPESPMLTNSSSSVGGHQPVQQTGGQHQQEACSLSTQKQQQPTQQHFQPPQQQQQQQQMDLMKFLSAAVANGAVLNPQLMLNSLGAQLPPHLRRSSPNLLSPGDYPSAFRPPFGGQPSGTAAAVSALEPAIAAAAAAQVLFSQQQQQQHQQPNVPMPMQRLSLPSGQSALPFLLRQNSFGGLGFSEQQLQNSQSEDRNK